jgi:hypothetical protein
MNTKKIYDNILPINIIINVNYLEDDDENIIQIDEEGMREEFECKLKRIKYECELKRIKRLKKKIRRSE